MASELQALAQLPQSFRDKVMVVGDCWLWIAGKQSKGYGVFYPTAAKAHLAHRWAYEQLIGPIPKGLTLDHTRCDSKCSNPFCCTPTTRGANAARYKQELTRCKNGHEFNTANTRIRPNGHRVCKNCERISKAARHLGISFDQHLQHIQELSR